jgi:hypothetical protein
MAVDPMPDIRFAGQAMTLAASADRDRAIDVLKAGFAEGRLTKAEYDDRVTRVYASRTYGELGPLIADLPARGLRHRTRAPWTWRDPPSTRRPWPRLPAVSRCS